MSRDYDNFEEDELGFEGGDMSQYESYEAFNVELKLKNMENAAKTLIVEMCELYLDLEKVDESEYVSAVASVESQNLQSLLMQVKYADHALASVMRQLDAGGFVNPEIYDTIVKLQKNSVDITLQVSKYVRNLPEYFKYLDGDMKTAATTMEILEGSPKPKELPEGEKPIGEFGQVGPVRGLRSLMLQIQDEKMSIDNEEQISEELKEEE